MAKSKKKDSQTVPNEITPSPDLPAATIDVIEVEIVPPDMGLIQELAKMVKPTDKKAMMVFNYSDPEQALIYALGRGDILFVGKINKKIVCALAIIPKTNIKDKGASIWLICTPTADEFPVTFLKRSKQYIDKIADKYDYLDTIIDEEVPVNVKYAEFMGFKATDEVFAIINDRFRYFKRDK